MCGIVEVEAESFEEAIKKAKEDSSIPLPDDKNYIDDSWKVDLEMSACLAKEDHGE